MGLLTDDPMESLYRYVFEESVEVELRKGDFQVSIPRILPHLCKHLALDQC